MNDQLWYVLLLFFGLSLVISAITFLKSDYYLQHKFVGLTYLRGLTTANKFWWNVSDLIENDPMGYKLMSRIKLNTIDQGLYKDFVPVETFGYKYYLVFRPENIEFILKNSPSIFGVGHLKYNFFKSFMPDNVGVSNGAKWCHLREANMQVLDHGYLTRLADQIIAKTENLIVTPPKTRLEFENLADQLVPFIVFGTNELPEALASSAMKIFREANEIQFLVNENHKLDPIVVKSYCILLNYFIQKPIDESLIGIAKHTGISDRLLMDQIPHWIFPVFGVITTSFPRLLTFLYNSPTDLQRVLIEIGGLDNRQAKEIYGLRHLRNCILETLRLNNTVISLFRTLLQDDFQFPAENSEASRTFKRGDQFSILIANSLRDPEYFPNSHQFIPDRWINRQLEHHYPSLMWSIGPQGCPGKELSIFLLQVLTVVILKRWQLTEAKAINTEKIGLLNPFNLNFKWRCNTN